MLKPEYTIFVWGVSVGIYYFLDTRPETICLTNTPLITDWTPQSWKDELIRQLQSHPPRFFIAESGDDREYVTGTQEDSWQKLLEWSPLRDFIRNNYDLKDTIG